MLLFILNDLHANGVYGWQAFCYFTEQLAKIEVVRYELNVIYNFII